MVLVCYSPIQIASSSQRVDQEIAPPQWTLTDLRTLDPPDALSADQDILAVYLHLPKRSAFPLEIPWFKEQLQGDALNEFQIRIDFLDLSLPARSDLLIAIDHAPGGNFLLPNGFLSDLAWDTLISIPAYAPIQAWDREHHRKSGISIWIARDMTLDFVTIHIKGLALPPFLPRLRLQVYTFSPAPSTLADRSPVFSAEGGSPSAAPVLFVFWNTFPAYTPAQALRRWDGAHTGPSGGRHGLYNLLRLARNHHVPLVLLDLKYPTSLPALDYVGGVHLVQELLAQNLLILPDVIPFISAPGFPNDYEPLNRDLITYLSQFSSQIAQRFNLPATPFLYAPPSLQLPSGYTTIFMASKALGHQDIQVRRWQDRRVIPIPPQMLSPQATSEGLSLEVKRLLIQMAIQNSASAEGNPRILLLGGDLPNSEWGIPSTARAGFGYINAHPWIRLLGAQDLLGARAREETSINSNASSLPPSPLFQVVSEQILSKPRARLSEAATQVLLTVYAPLTPQSPQLPQLRANYLGQVGIFSLVDQWNASPSSFSSCNHDPDLDGENECILADAFALYIFKPTDGSLTYAFIRTDTEVHQIIAPSSQLAFGLSDPFRWNLKKKLKSDPEVIAGAFADDFGPYQVILGDNWLVMQKDTLTKIFRLMPYSLQVEYRTESPIQTDIPLVIDPWERFNKNWFEGYSASSSPSGWECNLSSGVRIQIYASSVLDAHTFQESRAQMSLPENPNAEFSPGHYLPFPLFLLHISAPGNFNVDIHIVPHEGSR